MDLLWTCKCCGKQYDTLSFAYALDQPDPWNEIPETERKQRAVLGSDGCVIDEKEFYLRGRILLPVIGSDDPFIWGCWVSISPQSYGRVEELWKTEIREHEPPFPGSLASDISIYPKTFNLKCSVHLKNAGRRPSFELEPTNHPLGAEQRNGITLDSVKEIAALVLQHSK